MAYVIGNTIEMPQQPTTWDVIGQSLLAGIQQAIQQRMMQQFAKQYNLVPVSVTDENGQPKIEWRYKLPYEEQLRRAQEIARMVGGPIGLSVDAQGNVTAKTTPEEVAGMFLNPEILQHWQRMGFAPYEDVSYGKGFGAGINRWLSNVLGTKKAQASGISFTPSYVDAMYSHAPLQREYMQTPAPVNTAPKGTGTLPPATKKKRELVSKYLPKKARKGKSFLEIKLRSPRGEYQWVDAAVYHKYKDTDYNDWTPVESRPKRGYSLPVSNNGVGTRMNLRIGDVLRSR